MFQHCKLDGLQHLCSTRREAKPESRHTLINLIQQPVTPVWIACTTAPSLPTIHHFSDISDDNCRKTKSVIKGLLD